MGEKDSGAKPDDQVYRKLLKPEGDFVDPNDSLPLITDPTFNVLSGHYNFFYDPHTRDIIEKIKPTEQMGVWEVAYEDSVRYFERLMRSGFTDEFATWLEASYTDTNFTTRTNMINAASVGMGVVVNVFETHVTAFPFVEELDIVAQRSRTLIKDTLSKKKIDMKNMNTALAEAKRGRIPVYQPNINRIVNAVAQYAVLPVCVVDGAVVTYDILRKLSPAIFPGEDNGANQLPVNLNAPPQFGTRSTIITLADQARVNADQGKQR